MADTLEILLHPMVLPISIALVAGGLAYVVSRVAPALARLLALAGCAAMLVYAIRLARGSETSFEWTWTQLTEQITLAVQLNRSTLGMLVVIGSAAFGLLISLYSFSDQKGRYWEGKFYTYLLWAMAGACVVGLAGNLLVLLVGWEITTLMLFLMVNQGRDAKAGAAKAYGILGFADACLLLAIVLLATLSGGSENWSLTAGPRSIGEMGATGYAIYLLILVAALAKAGAIPIHTWIPSIAGEAPTPAMALLPASVDKLLGIYLLAVLSLVMFRPDGPMQTVMMIVGGVTIIAAVLMAMMQHNLKKLLSFHAVSQVGYMLLGIGTGTTIGVIGGLFHMVNNAIYKSNLFLMSGTIGRAAGSDELEEMGGLARCLPITFVCGLISAAAISGIPPFNGFVSKWLIYQSMLELPNRGLAIALLVVAVFGSALTLASFVKVMYSAFLSAEPKDRPAPSPRPKERLFLAAPMIVLAAACVVLGLLPGLMINNVLAPAISAVETTGSALVVEGTSITTGSLGIWSPTQTTQLILIGLALGLLFIWVSTRKSQIRIVRPFLAGEVPSADDDRFRVPGTHFYETIGKLPVIGGLLAHGQAGTMDLYRWVGKYGSSLVEMLRGLHTGRLRAYVAWCVLGLVATLVYLLLATGA